MNTFPRVRLHLGFALFLGIATITPAANDAADRAMATIRPEGIRADMRFLSDDLLEGRRTGTRGHEIAANFMASQFEALGLEPAGDNGTYFQSVPFRASHTDESKTTMSWTAGGKEEMLAEKRDFLAASDPDRAEVSVEAPVVFAGYGITAPELRHDDYAPPAAATVNPVRFGHGRRRGASRGGLFRALSNGSEICARR